MSISDFKYLISSQFCKVLALTACVALWLCSLVVTLFPMHIIGVVFGSTEKQMIRSDADRIIASMAHEYTSRDCAISQFVGYAMRYISTMITSIKRAVTKGSLSSASPEPATIRIGFIHLFPEALFKRFVTMPGFGCAWLRAVEGFPSFDIGLISRELCMANETFTSSLHIETPFLLAL